VGKVDHKPKLQQQEFFKTIARCRFLLITSIKDASPRILTQALALNTGIILNKYIIGGWKYVND
jgi:hypothetical protein